MSSVRFGSDGKGVIYSMGLATNKYASVFLDIILHLIMPYYVKMCFAQLHEYAVIHVASHQIGQTANQTNG